MPFLAPLIPVILVAGGVGTTTAAIIGAVFSVVVGFLQARKQRGPERQASVLEIRIGETPREAIFGPVATAGQLINAYNTDDDTPDDNDYEILIIKLADHKISDLEGFIIDDQYYGFVGDGAQPSFTTGGRDYLEVYFLDGSAGQVPPAAIVADSEGQYLSTDKLTGCAYVVVRYLYSTSVWAGGRPKFKWHISGLACWDPRFDTILAGGTQDYDDPSTWQLTFNPIVQALNYRIGVYNRGMEGSSPYVPELVVGRGIPKDKAIGDYDEFVAAANVCDELVSLKAGGSQRRYDCGLIVKSDDAYGDVLEKFAAACAGEVVSRRGRIEIIPGTARTPHDGFTDDDLVRGEAIEYQAFASESDRVNTVVARYPDPYNFWEVSSAPMRRVYADLLTDGLGVARPYEVSLDLEGINDGPRAQRIAEIRRRQGRLERTATVTLPARFINLEVGDWIPWTSVRYLNGNTVMFRCVKQEMRPDLTQRVTLREIEDAVYDWDAETDELDPGDEYLPGSSTDALLLETGDFLLLEDGTPLLLEDA